MRLSKALIDMEMADYSAALDPAYTTLEFENMQVLAMGNGKSPPSSPLRCGGMHQGMQEENSLGWLLKWSRGGLAHGRGISQQLPADHGGGSASLGKSRGSEQCCAQHRQDGAGHNERLPPDIQHEGWG